MNLIYLIFPLALISNASFSAPTYDCEIEFVKKGTLNTKTTKKVSIDYKGFSEKCAAGKCFRQDVVVGGKPDDLQDIMLISHQEDGNPASIMLMDLRNEKSGESKQGSLAGSNFKSRVYMQVSTPDPKVDVYVNCLFNP